MELRIKARTDKPGHYGVTPFDTETGESMCDVFGTRIFPSLHDAEMYAQVQCDKIRACGGEATYTLVGE